MNNSTSIKFSINTSTKFNTKSSTSISIKFSTSTLNNTKFAFIKNLNNFLLRFYFFIIFLLTTRLSMTKTKINLINETFILT